MTNQKQADKQRVSGVILIDKPKGMTSQQVVSKVKYLFKSPIHDSKKAGHTGTLDPMATGLLPICLGEATKFSHYQLDADKSYQAIISLGHKTDTGDADGQVIATAEVTQLDQPLLERIAQKFLGAQQQIPPMYSALKKDGKKLYEYARAGIEVERPARDIIIKDLQLTIIDDTQLQLRATCTKGTYIRVLGEDIAQALGTLGHLTALRRLQVGKFAIDTAITILQLEALEFDNRFEQLLPVDACIEILATLKLTTEQVQRVRQGQRLNVSEQMSADIQSHLSSTIDSQIFNKGIITNTNSEQSVVQPIRHEIPVDIRLVNEQGHFIGLGALSLNGRLQPKKLIHL